MDTPEREINRLDEIWIDNKKDMELMLRKLICAMVKAKHEGSRLYVWICQDNCLTTKGGKDE